MTADTHPIEKEQVMAYLDGELAPEQAARVAMHLEQCSECRELAADLRGISSRLLAWSVEPASKRLEDAVLAELSKPGQRKASARPERNFPSGFAWKNLLRSRWAWAGAGAAVLVVGLIAFSLQPKYQASVPGRWRSQNAIVALRDFEMTDQLSKEEPGRGGGARGGENQSLFGPMIARTASLKVSVKDFSAARASMDRITTAHQGYVSSLSLSTEKGAPQSLGAKLAIPAAQCDAALADLRALGRVEQEQQSSEEVSSQVVDLDARLKNARETEAQLTEILRARTGKIGDVLEVEKEMARVRGEIETMEAEQKQLRNRVAFASIDLNLTEEYQAQLSDAPSAAGRRIRNALVDGYHDAASGLLAVFVFLLSIGPSILLWALILLWPARWAWRRWRNSRSPSTVTT